MRRFLLAATVFTITTLCSPAFCQRLRYDSMQSGQREFSIVAGYGHNHRIPDATKDDFSFDILKFRYGWFTSPRTELYTDLSLGNLDHPQENYALSTTISYRRFFAVRGSTSVSYDLSFGFIHFSDEMSSLGTKTNFTEQLGVTLHYATGTSSALSLGYTFSHTSNAGIRLPNLGINASMISVGQTWYR